MMHKGTLCSKFTMTNSDQILTNDEQNCRSIDPTITEGDQ
jgi:hypothetical protein